MKDFKVGDRIILTKNFDFAKSGSVGTIKNIESVGVDVLFDEGHSIDNNYWWFIYDKNGYKKIQCEDKTESTTKKIKQSLLRLYLSNIDKTIKSEKIIGYVKQEIGTEYKFGDTILRALRQLRQDGKLDYEIDGAKQDRNYKFKAV